MILICPVVMVFLLEGNKAGIVAKGMEDVKKRSAGGRFFHYFFVKMNSATYMSCTNQPLLENIFQESILKTNESGTGRFL
jgi:hypothetical protein